MTKKNSHVWALPAAFVEYLDGLVDNNLLDKDGSTCYKRYERRSIHTYFIGEYFYCYGAAEDATF